MKDEGGLRFAKINFFCYNKIENQKRKKNKTPEDKTHASIYESHHDRCARGPHE